MEDHEIPLIVTSKNPKVAGNFNPVIPPPQTDFDGGTNNITGIGPHQLGEGEILTADIEEKLDLQPDELTNDDPTDPNYKPAYTRSEKWDRYRETGEV